MCHQKVATCATLLTSARAVAMLSHRIAASIGCRPALSAAAKFAPLSTSHATTLAASAEDGLRPTAGGGAACGSLTPASDTRARDDSGLATERRRARAKAEAAAAQCSAVSEHALGWFRNSFSALRLVGCVEEWQAQGDQ